MWQHSRIFGWGHIGRGRTNIAPTGRFAFFAFSIGWCFFVRCKLDPHIITLSYGFLPQSIFRDGSVRGTITKGLFVQGAQHPRIVGRGHIGWGRTNISPDSRLLFLSMRGTISLLHKFIAVERAVWTKLLPADTAFPKDNISCYCL